MTIFPDPQTPSDKATTYNYPPASSPTIGMFSRASSNTPHTPKLRASCDTCLLAKVKCSKAFPMCSRCLAFGAECKYSPSSRAGKPKSDGKGSRPSVSKHKSISEDSKVSSTAVYLPPPLNIEAKEPTSYFPETDWTTSPTSNVDGQEHRHLMLPPLMHGQSSSESNSSRGSIDTPDPYLYYTHASPAYITSPYVDNNHHQQRHESMTDGSATPSALWFDQTESFPFSTSDPCDRQYLPMPNLFTDECLARTTTCSCFNGCLQALQTLHNFNAVPPASSFDIVLTVNQKAMETCTTTLNCPVCNSRTGFSLRTMLLGTILGRIILIYQGASKDYFGPASGSGSQPLPLTLGVYRVASEDIRWMQLVIILRDLKKFKALLIRFQETSKGSEAKEDIEIHGAVTNHLYQSLHLTYEALKKHKSFAWGQVD